MRPFPGTGFLTNAARGPAALPAFRSQPIQGCPIHTKGAGNIHKTHFGSYRE
jgi:hypothetical protein